MRQKLLSEGANELSYEIREIVKKAELLKQTGLKISWENIGDPIEKGEQIAPWIRDILRGLVDETPSWGYCDTAGVPETRALLLEHGLPAAHLHIDSFHRF